MATVGLQDTRATNAAIELSIPVLYNKAGRAHSPRQ